MVLYGLRYMLIMFLSEVVELERDGWVWCRGLGGVVVVMVMVTGEWVLR